MQWGYSFIGLESDINILKPFKFIHKFIDKETKA